jgi:hypothetical protein
MSDDSDYEYEQEANSPSTVKRNIPKYTGKQIIIPKQGITLGVKRINCGYCPTTNTNFKRPALRPIDSQAVNRLIAVPFKVVCVIT